MPAKIADGYNTSLYGNGLKIQKRMKKHYDPTSYSGDFVPLTDKEEKVLEKCFAFVGIVGLALMAVLIFILWK